MYAAVGAAQWVVGKALAPVADGVLEAWGACKNLGLNIEALRTELLLVRATLEIASSKQLGGPSMEELLQKLRDSAHKAEDLLDELDYFRIHDGLHGTYDAADEHANGGVHNLILNARHTSKAVGKLLCFSACSSAANAGEPGEEDARQRVNCSAWPPARQRARGNSSSAPNANQADEELSGCTHKLGKILPCSSFPSIHNDDDDSGKSTFCGACMRKAPPRKHAEETPKLRFNRFDVSKRMKDIVDELQPVRKQVTEILQICGRNTVPHIAHSRPITTNRSIEPKLYGRDLTVNRIVHDITKGKCYDKDLTVLPIVGLGGIGKTTMIQHIYHNQEVQNHFQVLIWVCVSVSFNLNKLLEDIKKHIPQVEEEKESMTTEELIEQRLKSKRFLLVLDDIWECSNEDDWEKLLLPLKGSQKNGKNGSMILVTTRFEKIAQMVKTTDHSIKLEGLESKEFRELFLAFVFGDEQCRRDYIFLLETGDKIMAKLKGSPLAAKTVGRLLRNNLNLSHWRRVLESKQWESQTDSNGIMPALKLSYDYLPFHLQQCFSYSALFPEDYKFRRGQLISLWIGLDILQPDAQNKTYEDIGSSNLEELVTHGFFKEEETKDHPCYVMHDLLHDLALQIASHECLSLHRSNVGLVQIQPCIRHLSIIIDDVNDDNCEKFKSELTKLKVEHLQTLMFFGETDESFANILGDIFKEVTALRVLHLPNLSYSVELILHQFSALVHLRYLCLGNRDKYEMHPRLRDKYGMHPRLSHRYKMRLPVTISRFYHLRILDLGLWDGSCDLPKDMSNLAKLCRFYTPYDELHSDICNVGKLKLLEELKVFRVNKESKGFEPKQLEHLTELRELGIYNLEKIHTKEAAAEAKLIEKNYLQRLTLGWDSQRSNAEPDVEAVVLESLQPHGDLKVLCIRAHRGPSCPTWLGDGLAVESLQSLFIIRVSWEVLPSFGKMWELRKLKLEHIATLKEFVIEQNFRRLIELELIGLGSFKKWVPPRDTCFFPLLQVLIIEDCPKLLEFPFSNDIVYPAEQNRNTDWFPKLQKLEIRKCPRLLLAVRISWIETLCDIEISGVKLLDVLHYSKSSNGVTLCIIGKNDLHSLDQVLVFNKETGLEVLELRKCPPLQLTSLMMLTSLKTLIVRNSDALTGPLGGQDDVELQLPIEHLIFHNLSGPTGRELNKLLPHLPRLSNLEIGDCGKEEDEKLLFPAHLSESLQKLEVWRRQEEELVTVRRREKTTLLPDGHSEKTGGGLQALRSLRWLKIADCSFSSPSCHLFPSSLQYLKLSGVDGMGTMEPLSNLTSLTELEMWMCGEDLRCEGMLPLLTTGQLSKLKVYGSPRFFVGWDPRSEVLQDEEDGGEEQQLQLVSPPRPSTLRVLETDDAEGLLAAPICSLLSSSLTDLVLYTNYFTYTEIEHFTKEQEDALHLLASLEALSFERFDKLQHLPAGLHKHTNLKRLKVCECPAVRSLPKDGLPKSLQELNVWACGNEELNQQCRGLVGTIPKIL